MKSNTRKGFTLIELLVVIAIIAILAVVVVLTLNPAQLLAQSRDSNRVSDFATLKSAIALYQADVSSTNMGTPATLYAAYAGSVPPTAIVTSTASTNSWGIITYAGTSSTSTSRSTSAGWLPMNFSVISSGAPFGAEPVDPLGTASNTSCTGGNAPCMYTYISNATGQYKLTSKMESTKYNYQGASDVVSTDGGNTNYAYEQGTNPNL